MGLNTTHRNWTDALGGTDKNTDDVTDEQKDRYLTPERRVTLMWLVIVGVVVTFFILIGSGIDPDEQKYLDTLHSQEDPEVAVWVEGHTDGQLLRMGKDVCHQVSAGSLNVNSRVQDIALAYLCPGAIEDWLDAQD